MKHWILACLVLATSVGVLAQQSPAPQSPSKEADPEKTAAPVASAGQASDEVIELSPFVVGSTSDRGYRATSTLVGTRIDSKIGDLGAAISVYTRDFIDDIGATNAVELLTYAVSTEVAGLGGTISNTGQTSFGLDFVNERLVVDSTTRIRGLAAADNTRNLYRTLIPFDTYNIDRVTINRGANNILFGLGSPAGIIDRSFARPMGSNRNRAEFRVDEHASVRSVLDFDRALVKGKLNARLVALHDWREFQQADVYDQKKRLFGTVEFTPTRTIRAGANFEVGKRDSAPPYLDPPRDRLTPFWVHGKPIYRRGVINTNTQLDLVAGQPPRGPLIVFGNTNGAPQPGFVALPGAGTGLRGAVLQPSDSLWDVVAPAARGNYTPQHIGINDLLRYNNLGLGNPYVPYARSLQIIDRSVYDWKNNSLSGRNDQNNSDFDAFNLYWEQDFLDRNVGFQLSYDQQRLDSSNVDFLGGEFRGRSIGLDVSEALIDGSPNPNFGRAYVIASPRWAEASRKNGTLRATAFAKLDAAKSLPGIGRWLGKHTFTGMFEQFKSDSSGKSGQAMAFGEDFGQSVGYAPVNQVIGGVNANLQSMMIHYISPSLLNQNSPTGAGITGMARRVELPRQGTITYINSATRRFETKTFQGFTYPNDKAYLTEDASLSREKSESIALSAQSRWLDEKLVSTLGWRQDEFRQYSNTNAPFLNAQRSRDVRPESFFLPQTPNTDVKDNTLSWSLVGHAPDAILRRLPTETVVSVHYGTSENFRPSAVGRNPFGGFYAPESGETTEYGFSVSYRNRLSMRVNWYETSQKNLLDDRVTALYDYLWDFVPKQVYNNNTLAVITASGFKLPDQRIQTSKQYQVINNGNGTARLETNGNSTTDTIDAVSKGLEVELVGTITENWRVTLNIAKQESVRTGTGQTAGAEFQRYATEFINLPLELKDPVNNDFRVRVNREALIRFRSVLAQDGRPAQEVSKWRVNLVNNYDFRSGRLKGFSVGGGYRWQEGNIIGNEIINDPTLGIIPDVKRTIYGPAQSVVDGWVGYKGRISESKNWWVRLHVTNLLGDYELIPVFANPAQAFTVGTPQDVYRVVKGREFSMTFGFDF
jgi:outer membrane receptor protein involved in Fe transport